MPTITNFGDVVTQGNTTATGNLTVQGTGTCAFSSASSAVTMAGTLAITGVTTHTANIIPSVDLGCGIGTSGTRFGNIYSANTNIYTTANIFTANIILANVTNTATFQNSVYHFQNTFSTGYIQTTGVIIPTTTGISGLGGPTLLFANAFLQTANIGSSTAQLSLNVTGNVFISNSINVTNVLAATINATYMNVITGGYANMASINVFTGANATFLTVQTLANVYGTANIVTSNTQTANIVFANVQNINVSTGANTTYLSVQTLANVYGTANIVTSNTQFANIVTSNIQNLNVYLSTNTAALTVTGIANVFSANVLTSNIQSANVVTANVQNLNVSTGANTTYLSVQTLANVYGTANIVTSNTQFANIVTSNVQNLNVYLSTNTAALTVTGIANVFSANVLTSNIQSANVVFANVQNLNVSTGANTTYLSVQTLANVYGTANIFTSNIQFANIVTSNIQNLNVYLSTNTAALTVTGIANIFSANVLTANVQAANVVTANVQNLNVSTGANITTLFVQTFANILSSNIVSAFHSTMNVSSVANVFTANIYNGNVQTTMNVSGLMSATLYSGNASALSNINASNVTMGILPFRNDGAIGQGATAISINGSVGVNNQYLSSTGTSLQWVGPPAAIFTQVPTSTNQIFYNSGNVAIGVYNWTQFGVGYNTFPGVPLDVYGGSGSFSNVSDATYTGTIRIMQNAASWAANGGLEFKTGTNIAGAGHRIVTTEITSSSGIAPLIFQYRANSPVWSNAMAIHNGTTTPGYVGIGTMAPLFQFHVYQTSNTNPATLTVQMSNTGQSSQLYLSNASGTTTQLYLNGPNSSADGPVNSATLRNNAGDLRLAGASTQPYIYLQTATNSVGFGTQTMVSSSNVSFWCPNVSASGFAHTVSADSKLGVSLYAGDPGQGQFVITGITNTNKRLAFMYDTSNNISLIQSMTSGTGTNPLILNGAGGNVGIGTTSPKQALDVAGYARIGSSSSDTSRIVLGPAPSGTNLDYASVIESISTVASNYASTLKFYTHGGSSTAGDPTLAMTISASQNVGVGAASPSDLIHVLGTSNPSIRIDAGSGGTTDPRVQFYSGATFRGRVAYSYGGGYMYYQNDTQDIIRLYNGASGALMLAPTSTTYVGVLTSSPLARFTIKNSYNDGSAGGLCLDATDGAVYNIRFYSYVQAGSQVGYKFTVNNGASSVDALFFGYNGYVGIANSGPSYPLDVTGKIRGSREIISSSITDSGQFRAIAGNYGSFIRNDASDTYWMVTASGDQYGSYNGLRPWRFNNASGYVTMDNGCTVNGGLTAGTGTVITGNEIALQYYNTVGATSKYVGVSGTGYCLGGMEIENTTLGGSWSQRVHFRSHYFGVSNGRRMTITEAGNVGIGTETAAYKQHIYNGDSSFTYYGPNASWAAYLLVGSGNPGNTTSGVARLISTNGNCHLDAGTGQIMYLNYYNNAAGGTGGIQSWGGWSHNGNFSATGNVTAGSDRRFKKNIEPIEDALEKVKKVSGYTFERHDMEGKFAGVIAQEMSEVLPEVVVMNKDGMYSVAYGNITALLIQALKEETAKREELERRLTRFEEFFELAHMGL